MCVCAVWAGGRARERERKAGGYMCVLCFYICVRKKKDVTFPTHVQDINGASDTPQQSTSPVTKYNEQSSNEQRAGYYRHGAWVGADENWLVGMCIRRKPQRLRRLLSRGVAAVGLLPQT